MCFREFRVQVSEAAVYISVHPFTFNEHYGLTTLSDNKVNLATIGIPEIIQIVIKPFDILPVVYPFQ